MASLVDVELPVASAPVIMVSPRDTQEGPQDSFHTPPEESSLPSSDNQRRKLAVDVDVDRCAINQAVDVDSGTQVFVDLGGFLGGSKFVDLGRDSELGFSEARLSQGIHAKLVPDCSRGAEGYGLGEIPQCHFDEFGVLEREFSELGELPVKKPKLSEQNLGFHSSGDCFEIEVVQLKTVTSAGDVNMIEGNKSIDEVVEGSETSDEDPGLCVLPISIGCRLENVANELESREGRKKKKCPVFYVSKVLSENNRDVEDNFDDVSLLDAAKLCGITFPRPRWWPDHYNFNN